MSEIKTQGQKERNNRHWGLFEDEGQEEGEDPKKNKVLA